MMIGIAIGIVVGIALVKMYEYFFKKDDASKEETSETLL